MNLIEATEIATEYVKGNLSSTCKVSYVKKSDRNWKVHVDVFEESEFTQTLGLKTNAKDKHTYLFEISEKKDIIGFERLN